MILFRLSQERDEALIVTEAIGLGPVGPCLKTSLACGASSAPQSLQIRVALNACCKARERYLSVKFGVMMLAKNALMKTKKPLSTAHRV
ncbi:hypothetical protein TNCV_977191 [Trichonephila clavipes]|nr:hypothetical protein TNCV_977191 [Trichonephila clavipes]